MITQPLYDLQSFLAYFSSLFWLYIREIQNGSPPKSAISDQTKQQLNSQIFPSGVWGDQNRAERLISTELNWIGFVLKWPREKMKQKKG